MKDILIGFSLGMALFGLFFLSLITAIGGFN